MYRNLMFMTAQCSQRPSRSGSAEPRWKSCKESIAGWAPPGKTRLVLGHKSLGRVLEPDPSGHLKKGDLVVGIVPAHIGVIQPLEEHRIPVSYIAGTSIGSPVGGVYATGRNAAEKSLST